MNSYNSAKAKPVNQECNLCFQNLMAKALGTMIRKEFTFSKNWQDLKYRTLEASSKTEAVKIDKFLKSLCIYKFDT